MGFIYFSSQLGCPPRPARERVSWCLQTSSIKTLFPGRVSVHSSIVSLFIFYILSYLLSKTMGYFSGCLMSSASDQKLFCGVCSVFKCSFDEFVGEKVVSPSYSSAILVPFLHIRPFRTNTQKRCLFHYRGQECKSRKSRNTWSNRQIWLWSTE